jgi:hypothetical protein
MTIKGASSGPTQALARIEQTNPWDGNYALEVIGYTNLNGLLSFTLMSNLKIP